MDTWTLALGIAALLFQVAALAVWIRIRPAIGSRTWASVVFGFAALISHRINELFGWSNIFGQISANLIAYTALYAVLCARYNAWETLQFHATLLKIIRDNPKEPIARQLAEHIVDLKDELSLLRSRLNSKLDNRKADTLAYGLACHFANTRDQLETISTQLKLYKDVADVSPLPVIITDTHGRLTYANEAYLRLLNTDLDSVLDTGWRNFVTKDTLDAVSDHWLAGVDRKDKQITGSLSLIVGGKRVNCVYAMTQIAQGYCGFVRPLDYNVLR